MKTTAELVLAYRDALCGMIADASTRPLKGPELSLQLRAWFKEVDVQLAKLIHEARNETKPPDPKPPAAPTQQAQPPRKV
jgi:hypothetical protein